MNEWINIIFIQLKLWIASASHNFKWLTIQIKENSSPQRQTFPVEVIE